MRPLVSACCLSALVLAACHRAPAPDPVPPPPAPMPADPARDLLGAHNHERAARGLPAYAWDDRLARVAQIQADLMARHDTLTHGDLGAGDLEARYERVGYRWSAGGENAADGQRDIPEVMAAWMGSPGHRANVLGHCEQMGAARARSAAGTPYWCVDFGSPARSDEEFGAGPLVTPEWDTAPSD